MTGGAHSYMNPLTGSCLLANAMKGVSDMQFARDMGIDAQRRACSPRRWLGALAISIRYFSEHWHR